MKKYKQNTKAYKKYTNATRQKIQKIRPATQNSIGCGCYVHCGPHLSMIFRNRGQVGRRAMQKSCTSVLYF